jgi:membrane protein YqaA with SNARE-associated domain
VIIHSHGMAVLASLLAAITGGTLGAALGLWLEHWMGDRRDRTGRCPHGFMIGRDCPACAHFAQVRAMERNP